MAKGGGSAGLVLALGLLILVASQCAYVEGARAIYTVGGIQGWGPFAYSRWLATVPKLKAGDQLVFRYNPSVHDVMVVGYKGFKSCRVTGRPKQFRSGKDKIALKKGWNYFICGVPGHCAQGMKLAVKAV